MMADQYATFGSLANPSFFGNQGQFVETFAPVTPLMDTTGRAIRYNDSRMQHTPYDMFPGMAVSTHEWAVMYQNPGFTGVCPETAHCYVQDNI
jgi:hypothetical protein